MLVVRDLDLFDLEGDLDLDLFLREWSRDLDFLAGEIDILLRGEWSRDLDLDEGELDLVLFLRFLLEAARDFFFE